MEPKSEPTPEAIAVGRLIADRRSAKALSQKELGRRCGVSGVTVHNWEKGKGKRAEHLIFLARELDLPLKQLVPLGGAEMHVLQSIQDEIDEINEFYRGAAPSARDALLTQVRAFKKLLGGDTDLPQQKSKLHIRK
jgi:transcriptional regulator with XRE-family HTH domain